jgi:hypothetical protein
MTAGETEIMAQKINQVQAHGHLARHRFAIHR